MPEQSFWALRFAAFLLGVVALLVFVIGLRGRYGMPVAAMAGLALSAAWGFFGSSHYVRWDSLAFVMSCTVLVVLIRRAPNARVALLLGLMFGVVPDIEG